MFPKSSSFVKVKPSASDLSGRIAIPNSKPHMQRALLLGLLANSPSIIVNPAWSSESSSLISSAEQLGMKVAQQVDGQLEVTGVGRSPQAERRTLSVAGSAFNFRTLAAVAALYPSETTIEANTSMVSRPVKEYLGFVTELGGTLADASDDETLRIKIRGTDQIGRICSVDTEQSSQVLTAALLIAPMAEDTVVIKPTSAGLVGAGYVRLTETMMQSQGAQVERADNAYVIHPSSYRAQVHHLASDFTAMSYIAGIVAAAASPPVITIADYYPSELESENEFLATLDRLGICVEYDAVERTLQLYRRDVSEPVIEIDGRNIPTVIPTLAAIAPFVNAKVVVKNAAHVNNHKCRRIDVMIEQLSRLGCEITPHYDDQRRVDGFVTYGRQQPLGGVTLESKGDHRIFLSLSVAALAAKRPCVIEGVQHIHASFPDYLEALGALGVEFEVLTQLADNQSVA